MADYYTRWKSADAGPTARRHPGTRHRARRRHDIYLTGGAVRDIISGFPIRDLDFSVQGNPLKLQKDLERAEVRIAGIDEELKTLYLGLPGNVRAEITMARIERYEKAGKPPVISPATLIEDLRRRDFTVNAMALSLNPGSRGLLMDPFNGAADIEAKLLRVCTTTLSWKIPRG